MEAERQEAGGRKPEVGSQRSEDQKVRKPEVGGRKSEIRGPIIRHLSSVIGLLSLCSVRHALCPLTIQPFNNLTI
jgi:hypothetical protein